MFKFWAIGSSHRPRGTLSDSSPNPGSVVFHPDRERQRNLRPAGPTETLPYQRPKDSQPRPSRREQRRFPREPAAQVESPLDRRYGLTPFAELTPSFL